MPDNEILNSTQESIDEIGIPTITMELNASSVIPNAVDTTLSNSGEAADAKTVGDKFDEVDGTLGDYGLALAELSAAMSGATTSISTLDAKIDSTSTSLLNTLGSAVAELVPKSDIVTVFDATGASKAADAQAVGVAFASLNGSTLMVSAGSSDSISNVISEMTGQLASLSAWTANDIPMASASSNTIGDEIGEIESAIEDLNDATAETILYETSGDTIKTKMDSNYAEQPFSVHVDATTGTGVTISDTRITANHVVTNLSAVWSKDITWSTTAGTLTLSCSDGIPELNLILSKPVTPSNE